MPRRHLAGSLLGNPFRISDESARAKAVADYEQWLRDRIGWKVSPERQEIDRLIWILKRDGKLTLLCWCRDAEHNVPACHGDAIAKIIRERMSQDEVNPA